MSDFKTQLRRVKAELGFHSKDPQLLASAKTARPNVGPRNPLPRSPKPDPKVFLPEPLKKDWGSRPEAVLKISELPKSTLLGNRRSKALAAAAPSGTPRAKGGCAGQSVDVPTRPSVAPQVGVDRNFRALAKGIPTRKALFKLPEEWVQAGGATQLIGGAKRGAVDVIIGIDFGTSFTKAAVGLKDSIYPVTWEGVSNCMPEYLLPSEHTRFENGTLFIGQHFDATVAALRSDLKLPFINPAVSITSIDTASDFLAMVLRYIRAWVYRNHAEKIGNATIRWQLNLGSPSNGMENARLECAYRKLAGTGWIRSLTLDCTSTAEFAVHEWGEAVVLQDLIDFHIRPEFVAQMAGYMQSPQRQPGLHALIDVGGGTLDVVTFNVHQVDSEDTFPFLVPQIHPLGTHGLLQNRLCGVPDAKGRHMVDELEPIAAPEAFAVLLAVGTDHVLARDAIFSTEVRKVVRAVFETTKNKRYRLSDAWNSSVRTFFTGGGSPVSLYKDAVGSAQVPSRRGLQLVPLPAHPRLAGFSGGSDEYQRISVACGLAQDAFTLGRIVLAREVEDDRAIILTRQDRPDRDDMWPK